MSVSSVNSNPIAIMNLVSFKAENIRIIDGKSVLS